MTSVARVQSAVLGSSGSYTVTFAGSPLDSTHLLVAFIQYRGNTALTTVTPSGWQIVPGSGTNPTANAGQYASAYMYYCQGDGSVNSITVTSPGGGSATAYLVAFTGLGGHTPIDSAGQNQVTGGSGGTSDTLAPNNPAGSGVIVVFDAFALTVTFGSWSNSYANVTTPTGRGIAAWKDYTGSGGSYGTTLTWTTASQSRAMWAIFSAAAPTGPSYALGSTPVTLALGTTPVTAWQGAGG